MRAAEMKERPRVAARMPTPPPWSSFSRTICKEAGCNAGSNRKIHSQRYCHRPPTHLQKGGGADQPDLYIDPGRGMGTLSSGLRQSQGKKVIIRTLDIGADKQADYFQLDKEENPALGYRAIRICLTRKEIFKTQLRAILRASAFGTVSIMFPMVISVREVRDAKESLEECKAELKERGVAVGEVEVGIMIETPAAVMIAEELAEEVDFFSLGTNDLTQYTLAIDRQNPKLDNFYDPHHPAVLRMIRHTVEAGHRHGCWVGICGELGADPTLTETFLRMGLDELSVSPSAVLPLRKLIRGMDLSKAQEKM